MGWIHEISRERKIGSMSGEGMGSMRSMGDGQENIDSMRLVGRIYSRAIARRYSLWVLLVIYI